MHHIKRCTMLNRHDRRKHVKVCEEGVKASGLPARLIVKVNEHTTAMFAGPFSGSHGQIGALHAVASPNQEKQTGGIEGCNDLARRGHEHHITPRRRDRC